MKHFNKLFGVLAAILVTYSLIFAGFDFGKHHYQEAVPNLIIAFFWCAVIGSIALEYKQKIDRRAKMKFISKMNDMLDAMVRAEEETHAKTQMAAPVERHPQDLQPAENMDNATRVQIPVKDGSEPAVKPLTKSQQRRINDKKGLGPLTDEEVRLAKNEKRREARIAKKATETTAQTTIIK